MDDVMKHLRQFQTGESHGILELKIPLPISQSGLVERYCPSDSCNPRIFQLGDRAANKEFDEQALTRSRRRPGGDGTVCPYCGIIQGDAAFLSPRDREAALNQVRWAAAEGVREMVGNMMETMAHNFNRRSGNGMISLRMETKRGAQSPRPRPYREDMLRTLTCDVCARRYGVYAIGLFCPDCGASNVNVHFARELELIRDQATISQNSANDGKVELAYRLLGNAHEDVLTAFETYLKSLYRFLVTKRTPVEAPALCSKKAIGISFQNIERGKSLYAALNIDLYSACAPQDIQLLDRNIQKRHVIGHNLGLADETYANKLGEASAGTIINISSAEVIHFAEICATVVRHIVNVAPELSRGS
jgi:hypothetical protein